MKEKMPRKKTEIEKPPATKGRNPRVSKDAEIPNCHIHDNVGNVEAINIREKVCVKEEYFSLTKHSDGKYYCLFHLPTKEKNITKFEEIFELRLQNVHEQIAEIEKLQIIEQQNQAKGKLSHDYRYVWFPSWFNFFSERTIEVEVDFSNATFMAKTDFWSTTFLGMANFNSTIFSAQTNFNSATFNSDANFNSATFTSDASFISTKFTSKANFLSSRFLGIAYFSWVIFKADAFFKLATFTLDGYFTLATFESDADFTSTNFEEESQIFFNETNINGVANFNHAIFDGYIGFEGKKENPVFVGENARLILDNARIENAKKISFQTVRLEPSWFINTNATGFVFSDCEWRYADGKRLSVKTELENLKKRGFENPNALLMYACWQLADNYEESKSFRKASLFRQMANESRRLETSWYQQPLTLRWWYYLSSRYGESLVKAMIVLLSLILLIFPIIYTQISFQTCSKDRPIAASLTICESKDEEIRKNCTCSTDQITFTDAIVQSLTTATLQNVEYRKPLIVWGELWIILEKIFAPLQAALLALSLGGSLCGKHVLTYE